MEGNIKMDLKEIVCEDMEWTDIAKGNDKWRAVDRKCLMNSGFDEMKWTSWLDEKQNFVITLHLRQGEYFCCLYLIFFWISNWGLGLHL